MNRQYIGARYVPKIFDNNGSSEWVSGIAYEALTIVTYLNNSYTSKKAVPSSVGNPANNSEYWVNTGAYNAQVNELQNEVQKIKAYAEYANILDYGAISGGSGSVNASALSQAIASGKSIYVPNGTFLISGDTTYNLNDNQSLYCDGTFEIEETRNNAFISAINKKNIDIKIKCVCNVTPTATYKDNAHVLLVRGCENVYIHDCEIIGSMGDAIYLGRNYDIEELNYCKNVSVTRNKISNCKRNSIALCTGELIDINENYITSPNDGNTWNRSCVIDIEPNRDGEVVKDVKIRNNVIDATSNVNKSIIRSNIGSTKRPSVFENIEIVNNNITVHNNVDIVIYFDGNNLSENNANSVVISDNIIHGTCGEGMRVLHTRDTEICNNFIEEATTDAILQSYGSDDYTIEGNTITVSSGHAIHLKNNSGSGYVIKNNHITANNSTSETILHEGGSNTSNLLVESNTVVGTGTVSLKITGNTDSICAFNLFNGSLVDSATTNNQKVTNKVNGTFEV